MIRGFAAAIRWAAMTSSGHMVQVRETRIFSGAGLRTALRASSVCGSRACPACPGLTDHTESRA
ncbi:MAG: hypothetical protein LBQ57_10290 [Spirochaetales bacterium]|nr:hypothetical protein [Spirochaetales bacterium]